MKNNMIIYVSKDGNIKVDVNIQNEDIWMSQDVMANLYDTTKNNISMHLKNIFNEGELQKDSVVKKFLTTDFSSNSLSFTILDTCMLMLDLEVAKSSAICCWLSQILPSLAKRATDDLPSAVRYMIMLGWSLLIN